MTHSSTVSIFDGHLRFRSLVLGIRPFSQFGVYCCVCQEATSQRRSAEYCGHSAQRTARGKEKPSKLSPHHILCNKFDTIVLLLYGMKKIHQRKEWKVDITKDGMPLLPPPVPAVFPVFLGEPESVPGNLLYFTRSQASAC